MMQRITVLVTLLALALSLVQCFQVSQPPSVNAANRAAKTKLGAWSIPRPPNMHTNGFSGGAWYQECNPTARKTVYNDVFIDYGYADDEGDDDMFWVLPGSSPLGVGAPSVAPTEQPRRTRRQGPLRRAAKWAKRQILGGEQD